MARSRYFGRLSTVEIGAAFIQPPKPETAATWRAEAPKGFDFSLPCSQIVTHQAETSGYARMTQKIPERRRGACGHFKDTPEVAGAWEATRMAAQALDARFVVFQTPATFFPDADHLRDMYRFFKKAPRGPWAFVWQPRGRWDEKLIARVCGDLGLVRAYDPFETPIDPPKGVRYLRSPAVSHTEGQLTHLRRLGDGGPTYAYFTSRAGWTEAQRLIFGRAV